MAVIKLLPVAVGIHLLISNALSFHAIRTSERIAPTRSIATKARNTNEDAQFVASELNSEDASAASTDRRSFVTSASFFLSLACVAPASAAIDVSGLKQDSGGPSVIASQLKSYDGSGSARVNEIRVAQAAAAPPPVAKQIVSATAPVDVGSAATYMYRSGGLPSLRSLGVIFQRYEGYVEAPPESKLRKIPLSFDFPSDWLQLDKIGGGITYVDQRNGDKLYLLKALLPEGQTLESVPKSFFAESIFDIRGDIARSGTVIESGRTTRAQMVGTCEGKVCVPRRRLQLKYDTVTGNGVQTVERRALVDAYEVEGYAYMLMTSSNAVKFEAKGKERETVEKIVDSFRLEL